MWNLKQKLRNNLKLEISLQVYTTIIKQCQNIDNKPYIYLKKDTFTLLDLFFSHLLILHSYISQNHSKNFRRFIIVCTSSKR